MSINPYKGDCKPKNKIDQRAFNINWIPNTVRAFLLSFALLDHIKYKDMPIRKYSVIHTGANTQFGGEMTGFSSVAYQVVTDSAVNIDPIIPASWQIAIEMTILILLFIAQYIENLGIKNMLHCSPHSHDHSLSMMISAYTCKGVFIIDTLILYWALCT